MPLPLLVGLLGQGIRLVAPRLIQAGLTANRAAKVKNKIVAASQAALSKGKIPTNRGLLETLTAKEQILLTQPRLTGLLNQSVNQVANRGMISNPIYNIGARNPINRLVNPTISNRFPIPVSQTAQNISAREVLNRQAAAQAAGGSRTIAQNIARQNKQVAAQRLYGPQGKNAPLPDNLQPNYAPTSKVNAVSAFARNHPYVTGVGLTGAGFLGSGLFGGEQPVQATAMPTGRLLSQAPQQAQAPAMRFSEILRPSSQSTAKEVINASLLRAGLSLMKPTRPGQTPLTQALESAATVADSQNIFRTGAEALAAGKRNLGNAAKVYVQQRSDGTFGYSGTTDDGIDASAYFGEQEQADNVTKEQYDKAVATIKAQAPDATEQDIKDTLEANNIRYTGE